jgi:hypothetical protein
MTAHAHRVDDPDLSCACFLSKPFDPAALVQAVAARAGS